MLKYYLYYCIILASYQFSFSIISVTAFKSKYSVSQKSVVKRNENDFQACLDNFDIHTDKIIRTQDSRAMGAKYINERDVASREDCLRLCCETEGCDVFVFEEKNPGSCYLFECGSPEDFKCKFTRHRNYTSAVLAVNRHQSELETQIKFTQHEHELTKLREPLPSPAGRTTTEGPGSKEILQLVPNAQNVHQLKHECSRYQFTCHTSGECIAIYNACDGIPQCSDGSDEAPELGCPTQTSTAVPTRQQSATVVAPIMKSEKAEAEAGPLQTQNQPTHQQYLPIIETVPLAAAPQRQWPEQQQPFLHNHGESDFVGGNGGQQSGGVQQGLSGGYQGLQVPPHPQQLQQQQLLQGYSREGEGANYQQQPWPPYQYHPNPGGSQIFTHKGSGLMQQQTERYQPRPYMPNDPGQMGNQFDMMPNEMNKQVYSDGGYRMFPQNPPNNNWPLIHKSHSGGIEEGSRRVGQDYYYDDMYRRPISHPELQSPGLHSDALSVKKAGAPEEIVGVSVEKMKTVTLPPAAPTPPPTTPPTSAPKVDERRTHSAHRKMEKLTAEVTLRETSLTESEIDGHSASPSGAILSLTLGLCITAIMVVVVGCRMRTVHRRMRRGAKSPYAHDADFLVNGMYL